MDEQEIIKIENEIFEHLKDKIKNTSSKETQKIIETEVRDRNYLSEDWQIHYAVKRIMEKRNIKFVNQMNELEKPEKKKKWWQYRKIGRKEAGKTALLGFLGFALCNSFLKGGLITDIFGLIFWIAGIVWIIKTIQLKVKIKRGNQ